MGRRKHLPEREIQRLERLDEAGLEKHLSGLQPKVLADHFHQLLVAYRLAAHVANRAFAYAQTPSVASEEALLVALHDYAPECFPVGEVEGEPSKH